jgi:hypothetical protein
MDFGSLKCGKLLVLLSLPRGPFVDASTDACGDIDGRFLSACNIATYVPSPPLI